MVNGESQTPLSHPDRDTFLSSSGGPNAAIIILVKAYCVLSSHVRCYLQQSVM